MVLNKPVADWWFEDRSKLFDTINSEDFKSLLEMLQKSVNILKFYNLLIPSKCVLSDRWLFYSDENIEGIQKTQKNIDLTNIQCESISDVIMSNVLAEQEKTGFLCPSLSILGVGELIDEKSDAMHKFSNLVSIEACFIGARIIDVITNSTVWLPYSLDGKSRNDFYEKNAGRLESALKDIEKALNTEAITDTYSDYCCINGYLLDNFRSDYDDTIIGVTEDGHVMSS
jgi:hypothetical protein